MGCSYPLHGIQLISHMCNMVTTTESAHWNTLRGGLGSSGKSRDRENRFEQERWSLWIKWHKEHLATGCLCYKYLYSRGTNFCLINIWAKGARSIPGECTYDSWVKGKKWNDFSWKGKDLDPAAYLDLAEMAQPTLSHECLRDPMGRCLISATPLWIRSCSTATQCRRQSRIGDWVSPEPGRNFNNWFGRRE